MIRRKTKKPQDYTLEEIRKIADKCTLPPWGVLESLITLESFLTSYQQKVGK